MLSYYLKCIQKKTKSKTLKVVKTKNGRIMLLSKCEVCDSNLPKKVELLISK